MNDGTFIALFIKNGYVAPQLPRTVEVVTSHDEGRTWKKISAFPLKVSAVEYPSIMVGIPLFRLPDDTLLYSVAMYKHTAKTGWPGPKHRLSKMVMYRSTDGVITWHGPIETLSWVYEGGITLLPSGRLLAALRVNQRALATDPPNMEERMRGGANTYSKDLPIKHVFLLESHDNGRSWTNSRQLTTAYGQCYGYPTALADGTVVVIHDSRYGPGIQSGRAMISRDEGKTWLDEAYYIYYGKINSGYTNSVVLDDGLILTIAGTCDVYNGDGYEALVGVSNLMAIRWKPVND